MHPPASTFSNSADHDGSAAAPGLTTLILGCMFSGKTTELIRRVEAYKPDSIIAIKHEIDTRFDRDAIISHGGKAVPATPVSGAREIPLLIQPQTHAVAIDEGHFFDARLIEVVDDLNRRGIDIILTSLEPDSWGRPFPINKQLRSVAADCIVVTATCARCGAAADRTQRLTPIVGGNMVVDPSNYEPRCGRCWHPPVDK